MFLELFLTCHLFVVESPIMNFIQDEEEGEATAASKAFDNVGFESAGTAIRAVAEDIEIQTEEDGRYY